jgi:hypothetical protein
VLLGLSLLFHLSIYMSSFVAFKSRWTSLTESSRLNFALVVFILRTGEDLPHSSDDAVEVCQ